MVDIAKRVEQYVKLRDLIKQRDNAHKEAMAPYKEALENLNGVLLSHLTSIKADSASTVNGSVYRTAKSSASLADAKAFMDYVIANKAFDLIDRKANVVAVEEYIKAHNTPPPGVNYSSTFIVGVRRKS